MTKALIVFSDGTGNKGGVTHDTNVWRLYQMIDRTGGEQLTWYDDGVGTQNWSPLKAFSGAVGWGLSNNIKQAYTFLVRNYDPGDRIYLFGFSRGAYTVRALQGMLNSCWLVRRHEGGKSRTSLELDTLIDEAFHAYRRARNGSRLRREQRKRNCFVTTEFIGVWDTVDAVGMPTITKGISKIWEKTVGTRLYGFHDQMVKGARHARQALSIDDARTTFHPNYWNQVGCYWESVEDAREEDNLKTGKPVDVNQVWFAGVHSNCGGSYPKDGLAYVTLEWMIKELLEATKHPDEGRIRLRQEEVEGVRDLANDGDLLYDSRAGIAAFYRYSPRRLGSEEFDRYQQQPIQVHASVFARIHKRADNYAPLFIAARDGGKAGIAYTADGRSRYRRSGPALPPQLQREPDMDFPKLDDQVTAALSRLVTTRALLQRVLYGWLALGAFAGLAATPLGVWGENTANSMSATGIFNWIGIRLENLFLSWLPATLKGTLPAFAEHIVDNAWSYPVWSLGWLVVMLLGLAVGQQLARSIRRTARAGWDEICGLPSNGSEEGTEQREGAEVAET